MDQKMGKFLLGLLFLMSSTHLAIGGRSGAITNAGDLISATCAKTLYFDVCMSSLKADGRSRGADQRGLALIAVEASRTHAAETLSRVRKLKEEEEYSGGYMGGCLSVCLEEYSDAVENLRESGEGVRNRSYSEVEGFVTTAMTDSETCEEGFWEKEGYVSPLKYRNDYFKKLCSNILAITNLLL